MLGLISFFPRISFILSCKKDRKKVGNSFRIKKSLKEVNSNQVSNVHSIFFLSSQAKMRVLSHLFFKETNNKAITKNKAKLSEENQIFNPFM